MAIACAGYALGQCQPVRKLWNPATPGQCKDRGIFVKLAYANGGRWPVVSERVRKLTNIALNTFGDFALALFPISFIKDLHLEFHRKVVLILLMCCGVV